MRLIEFTGFYQDCEKLLFGVSGLLVLGFGFKVFGAGSLAVTLRFGAR